jgi:hypothetical protein
MTVSITKPWQKLVEPFKIKLPKVLEAQPLCCVPSPDWSVLALTSEGPIVMD